MIGLLFKRRYRTLKKIGEGGMAVVYLANDRVLDRKVAIKILKSTMLEDVSAMQRFKKEVKAATTLVHQNIVQVYDVDFDNDS